MRRTLAAAVLGISLWLGSLAWTGFVLLRTVLDPDRSRDVAEALYEDESVRAQLAEGIADAVAAALPPAVPVPPGAIEATAAEALDSPAVEAVFVDALVRTHAAFLGEGQPPDSVDPGAFGAAAREAIVARNPELDGVLPAAPALEVPLPTERVPDLGPVRDVLLGVVPLLALASASGIAFALLVARDRPRVVRRAGVWAIGLSALVLLVASGIPYLATALLPDRAAVVVALVGAVAETTRGPALALAGAGLVAVVGSILWRRAPVVPAPPPPPVPAPGRRPRPPRRDLPRPARPAAPVRSGAVRGPTAPPTRAPSRTPRPAQPERTRVGRTPDGPTTVQPATGGGTDPTGIDGAARRSRWVEGAGWVLDGAEAIPPEARWVPGVGYVVDEER